MRADRAGFTFIELLLVVVLGMIVLAGGYTTLLRQTDAYSTFSAMTGTQQDTRTGIDLLASELRELSASGADLVLATPDSIRFRALRSFGILCQNTHKLNKKLIVAQFGVQPFKAGDSILVYVDGDSLQARDDKWQREYVNTTAAATCGTVLGVNLGTLSPGATLTELTIGTTLKSDSVYPGAPVRSFNLITYTAGTSDGIPMLMRLEGGSEAPMLGPIEDPGGIELSYFDGTGTELTNFPLSAADRETVRRIKIKLRAERRSVRNDTYQDSLTTDVYLRGS